MSLLHKMYLVIISVGFIALFTACGGSVVTPLTPTLAAVATPNPLLATPQTALMEEPLATQIPEIASTWIVPSSMTKQEVAVAVNTTVDGLDWFNQGLPDPVPAGTIVSISRQYYAEQNETLAAIAEQLGLAIEMLAIVNPTLDASTPLQKGTLVMVPKLYTVPEEVTLETAATTLHVSVQALQAVNPSLADKATVPANTLLVIPPVESEVQQ